MRYRGEERKDQIALRRKSKVADEFPSSLKGNFIDEAKNRIVNLKSVLVYQEYL